MKKRMLLMIIASTLLFGLVFGAIYAKNQYVAKLMANYAPPPVVISAISPEMKTWETSVHSIGTLYANHGVELSTEVAGIIKAINFEPGQWVEKGQLLLEMDDSVLQADLKSYEAQLKLAQINYDRDKKLLQSKAISKTDFDTVEAKLRDIEAQVERTRAMVAQKRLYAPFPGRAGLHHLNIGQHVDSGDEVVTLQDTTSLYMDFSLPDKYLTQLKVGQTVHFSVDALGEQRFDAKVTAINAKVDLSTRNVQVRAKVDKVSNLLPGMFTNLELVLDANTTVMALPQTAISFSLFGDSVFKVSESKNEAGESIQTVQRVIVKTGLRHGTDVEIVEGLELKDVVVTSGQLKLSNGTRVVIDNSVTL